MGMYVCIYVYMYVSHVQPLHHVCIYVRLTYLPTYLPTYRMGQMGGMPPNPALGFPGFGAPQQSAQQPGTGLAPGR